MAWPTIEDYRTALQRPEKAFRDPRLQGCKAEMNRMGVPKGRTGAFAIVYRLSNGSWSTAVRVYLNPPKPDRQKRYQMVHEHLQKSRPGCLVDFMYDPGGILASGAWYPIQTLEWVEGEQLGEWVRSAVARGDKVGMKRMADHWVKLVRELQSRGFAHGDLEHGNIMVRGDQLMLVDYDCMYVPTMVSAADREPWENGMPGYEHPQRVGQPLGPSLDNFSAWVIFIALRAIADDFNLFQCFTANNDNLLFTDDDLRQPGRSKTWDYLLKNTRDRMVLEAVKRLRASLDGPFEKIPPFDVEPAVEITARVAAPAPAVAKPATSPVSAAVPRPAAPVSPRPTAPVTPAKPPVVTPLVPTPAARTPVAPPPAKPPVVTPLVPAPPVVTPLVPAPSGGDPRLAEVLSRLALLEKRSAVTEARLAVAESRLAAIEARSTRATP